MKTKNETLTKEELKGLLDLTPENVEKVFLYSASDRDGNRILSNDENKYIALIHEVNACEKSDDRFPNVYFNEYKLRDARVAVINFLRQLRITFLNKGLSPEDERYKKIITSDYVRLKICDGTNVTKMNDGVENMKFATVWADKEHPESLNQLLTLAVGLRLIEPLKQTNHVDMNGKPILAINTTKGVFPRMMPQMSMETKKSLEVLMMKQMQKPTPPTAPSGQGEDGGRE